MALPYHHTRAFAGLAQHTGTGNKMGGDQAILNIRQIAADFGWRLHLDFPDRMKHIPTTSAVLFPQCFVSLAFQLSSCVSGQGFDGSPKFLYAS